MKDKEATCLFRNLDQGYRELFETKYKTLFFDIIKITPYNQESIESIFTSDKIKDYDSLIITSRNTVSILNDILRKHNIREVPHISTYIISDKNKNNLWFECKTVISANGYAKDLCEKMEKDIHAGKIKNVLFVCGDKRLNTIPNFLNKHNINFDELKVYKTDHGTSKEIGEKITNVVETYKKIYFVFFSPSGIESFKNMFDCETNNHIWDNDRIQFVSIGTTTAESLKEMKKDVIIADLPEDKYIFECISNK